MLLPRVAPFDVDSAQSIPVLRNRRPAHTRCDQPKWNSRVHSKCLGMCEPVWGTWKNVKAEFIGFNLLIYWLFNYENKTYRKWRPTLILIVMSKLNYQRIYKGVVAWGISASWELEEGSHLWWASQYLVQHCLCQKRPKCHDLKVSWGCLRGKLAVLPLLYSECTIGQWPASGSLLPV